MDRWGIGDKSGYPSDVTGEEVDPLWLPTWRCAGRTPSSGNTTFAWYLELQRIVADDLCKSGCGVEPLIAGSRDLVSGSVEEVAIPETKVLHGVTRPGWVPRVCLSVLPMTACERETPKLL